MRCRARTNSRATNSPSSTSTAAIELIRKISPKTTKGVLGKEVKYGVADSEAKPNTAVQEQTALHQREQGGADHRLDVERGRGGAEQLGATAKTCCIVTGISGSNDTTGKDCVRYGFRQCFYGQTAAAAIGPVLLKAYGKGKKAAYLTPDYTYGHTVQKSMEDYLGKNGGWTTATNQVAPLGAPDYSSYLLNIANSGADVLLNVNWGHDAVLSTQQANQFGILHKHEAGDPLSDAVPGAEVGAELMAGRLCRDRFLVDARGQISAGQDVRRGVRQEIRLQAGMGRQQRLHGIRPVGRRGRAAGTFYPPDVIKAYEAGKKIRLDRRRGVFPRRRSSVGAAGDHRARQEAVGNEEQGRLLGGVEVVPGEGLMQAPDAFGCSLGDYT